jgi:hypothetical protein
MRSQTQALDSAATGIGYNACDDDVDDDDYDIVLRIFYPTERISAFRSQQLKFHTLYEPNSLLRYSL